MIGSRVAVLLLLPSLLAGCATLSRSAGGDDGDSPRLRLLSTSRDPRAEAYYDFAAAQLQVQAGRFKEAIPLLQEAIKRDPNSAFLWTQLAQWLIRADQPAEALSAAQKAVQLAPDDPGPHLTLAELLRAQKNFREAEAELEKVIELNPNNEDAYLTLARYQVEQKAY
ncbi:MAG TPA: tetratricopeptide repeat protein, partial [Caldimonas sp.]|nr:tetratricopeptide repeat protein [Caldimonas sp.]